MSDLDRLLAQVEELKKLAQRPDDAWMNSMSNEELRSLGKRVRKVADGLSVMQTQLRSQVATAQGHAAASRQVAAPPPMPQRAASGSLGNMVRKDTSATTPAPAGPSSEPSKQGYNPFREHMASKGMDLSNPLARRNRPNF